MINVNKYEYLVNTEKAYQINIHLENTPKDRTAPYTGICFRTLNGIFSDVGNKKYKYLVFNLVPEKTEHLTLEEKEHYLNLLLEVPEFRKYLSRQKKNILYNNKFKINLDIAPAHHLNIMLNLVRALQEHLQFVKILYDLKDYKFKLTPLQKLVFISSIAPIYNRAHWFNRISKEWISAVSLKYWKDWSTKKRSYNANFNIFFNINDFWFVSVDPENLQEFVVNE